VSFLLTKILLNTSLSNYIDSERIGMAGFSLGGYTSLALAGVELDCTLLKNRARTNQGKEEFTIPEMGDLRKQIEKLSCDSASRYCLQDSRIGAFVAMAPALGLGIGSVEQAKNVIAPILIIGAEKDPIAPVITNARAYNYYIPSSKYNELQGEIGHYVFLNEGNAGLKKEAKKYYLDDASVNRALVHSKLCDMIADFFESNLKEINNCEQMISP
jgi:predicted dienelactone hydrolase